MTTLSKLCFITPACALSLAAGLAFFGSNAASADDDAEGSSNGPCTATKFQFPEVKKACKDGGATGRRKVREDIMRPAKDRANRNEIKIKGTRVTCKSCHIDQNEKYELTDNAVEDLRGLLAVDAPAHAPSAKPAPTPAPKK